IGVQREAMVDNGLRFVRRREEHGHSYFIVNRGEKRIDAWVPLATSASSAAIFDPRFEDHIGVAAFRPSAARGLAQIYLQLDPGESCVVRTFTSDAASAARRWTYTQPTGDPQPIRGDWHIHFVEGGPVLPGDFQTRELT